MHYWSCLAKLLIDSVIGLYMYSFSLCCKLCYYLSSLRNVLVEESKYHLVYHFADVTNNYSFIHSFIYIAPLQETYSEALSVQLRSKRTVLRSWQKEDTLLIIHYSRQLWCVVSFIDLQGYHRNKGTLCCILLFDMLACLKCSNIW